MSNTLVTGEMIARYHDLNKIKKEIEAEMSLLKKQFHSYFDDQVGPDSKGEITDGGFKLQRQIRKMDKFNDELTVSRLQELKMNDLIKVVRKPDGEKIKAAINLGLLREDELEGCRVRNFSSAITVKEMP